MDKVESLLEILKYILPALVMFLGVYMLLGKMLEDHQLRLQQELRKANRETISPLRLQAYERIILYLERISPQQLIMHHNSNASSATALRALMLKNINDEFGYNMSQQIYMSHQAWDVIRVVKEQVISLINKEYEKLPEGATAADLSKNIINRLIQEGTQPTQKAIDFIKAEINLYFS